MAPAIRIVLERYGLALAAVLVALTVKQLAAPLVEADAPFFLFLGAVLIAAWYGGIWPGMLAAGLSTLLAIVLILRPLNEPTAWARLGLFAAEGILVALLASQGQRIWRRARKQRDWLGAILGNMGDAVLALDRDGYVMYLNPVAQELTGWSPDSVANHRSSDVLRLVDPQTQQPLPAVSDQWIPGLLLSRENRTTPVEARFTPLHDASGSITGTLVVLRDRTERQQVQRSEETVRELSRRKDEFLAMLSHELRNPLAPILNSLQILRLSDLGDPALAEARDIIDRQVRRLANMVDDLLDMYRIIQHKVTLHRESLDLSELVRKVTAERRAAMELAKLSLDVTTPRDAIWVQADRERLTQVLMQLLDNASKFSRPGDRVQVTLTADEAHQRAYIAVTDSGVGLSAEMRRDLFEVFAQGRQELARRRGGLGLGLTVVKGIIELHGGNIEATSNGLGCGTSFTFWLPLGRRPALPATPSGNGAASKSEDRLRLLIVEDNEDTAQTLELLMKRFGHDVRVAFTGTAGVELAHRWHPDVVLCDLGLPEMDGFEVATHLRRDPETASARLIAITGYGQEEDRRRSEAAGFDLHLTKPVDPLQLRSLLTVMRR